RRRSDRAPTWESGPRAARKLQNAAKARTGGSDQKPGWEPASQEGKSWARTCPGQPDLPTAAGPFVRPARVRKERPVRERSLPGELSILGASRALIWSSLLRGHLRGLDQFPELRILLECFVLLHFQSGAEEKVLECMATEDAVDHNTQFMPLKINPIIANSKPVQDSAGPLQFAEVIQLGLHHLLGQAAEFA